MKIKYLVSAAGPDFSVMPGDVRDVSKEEAERYIAKGYAVPAVGRPKKKAVIKPVETR